VPEGKEEKEGAKIGKAKKGKAKKGKAKKERYKDRMKVQVLLEADDRPYGQPRDAVMKRHAEAMAAGHGHGHGHGLPSDWALGSHSGWDNLVYPDREVVLVTLKDVFLSGNDGLIWVRDCVD
jgi:hypothetical protein